MSVVDFGKSKQFTQGAKRVREYQCAHRSLSVDEHRRLIICNNCDQCFEAFDYMLKVARQEINLRNDIKHLANEKIDLDNEVMELKRKRYNLKTQIKRLNGKQGELL